MSGARPKRERDWLGEGTMPYAETGVCLSDIDMADVTDVHRRKAQAYFAKFKRPEQGDLFGMAA